MVSQYSKVHNFSSSHFLLVFKRSGFLSEIRWPVFMSKSHWCLCVPFSRTAAGLCIYHLFVVSNLLHITQWITLPSQSRVVLYSFCANLLHSLIMWLIVSPLSPHSRYSVFCCVLPNFALIWLILLTLFYTDFRRKCVSFLKFPFLYHVHVFWCEMLLISRLKRTLSCFSSHFCYLVIVILLSIVLSESILMAVINSPSCFSL